MKGSTVVRGGIAGGALAAVLLATVGRMLAITIPPWGWSSTLSGHPGRVLEWARAAAVLIPPCAVLGIVTAFVCAIVFEFVTLRGGWWRGAVVGLLLGVLGAAAAGLVPWFAAWYGYAYMPSLAPLGPHDPSWPFVTLIAAGVVMGLVAGAAYGTPVRASVRRQVFRWRQIGPPDTRPQTSGLKP